MTSMTSARTCTTTLFSKCWVSGFPIFSSAFLIIIQIGVFTYCTFYIMLHASTSPVDALFKCGQAPGASVTTSKWRPLNGRGSKEPKRRRIFSQPSIRINICSQILHCGSQTRPRPSLRHLLWRQVSQFLVNSVMSGSLFADTHDQATPPSVFLLTLRPKVATATPNSTSQPLLSSTTAKHSV